MVVGTSSHVGKSVTVAAICRCLVRRGIRVAPFKSQNMSLNSFVTADGGEIGIAQAMQAWASRLSPTTDMNPVLLKPKGDRVSQVVLFGHPYKDVPIADYYAETPYLLTEAVAAFHRLMQEYGQVVVEGAGGAAEVNLYDRDIANTLLAENLKIPLVLVADIERGGVFAQIYGTLKLLPEAVRPLVRGIIINKFRGDPAIFASGITIIENLTGIPVLGVVPYFSIPIPSEDSLSIADKVHRDLPVPDCGNPSSPCLQFHGLRTARTVCIGRVRALWCIAPGYDCIVIPGTKNTIEDLAVLRESGTDRELVAAQESGIPVIGICGGYQMLGKTLIDEGFESAAGVYPGLGLLDCTYPVCRICQEYHSGTAPGRGGTPDPLIHGRGNRLRDPHGGDRTGH